MRTSRWALPLIFAASLVGAPAHADRSGEIVVVTHIDIIPTFTADAQRLLVQFVEESRNDPGVRYFTLISWAPTTNHFQLIEVFQNQRAFDAHVSAAHTRRFRDDLQPFIGAPYDERLYGIGNPEP